MNGNATVSIAESMTTGIMLGAFSECPTTNYSTKEV
jgi:hypothetical protein